MFETMGREDTCLQKLQQEQEGSQDDIYFLGLYRAYLGKHVEVGFEKVGGPQVYNNQPQEQRKRIWHYRDPTSGEVEIIEDMGYRHDRYPPHHPPFADWNSMKVMSKTFEPEFSKDWQQHPFPTRYNEYVLRNNTPWALQYIVAYKRGLKEDSDTIKC